MDPKTRKHLARAARNRDTASALLHPRSLLGTAPLPLEWAIVVAFYAAVHYVNAYLWEAYQHEPSNHRERQEAVARDPRLRAGYRAYVRLRSLAFQARYDPDYHAARSRAEDAVHLELTQVERAVLSALPRTTS